MPAILPHVTASLLYGLIGWYFWRSLWSKPETANAVAAAAPPALGAAHFAALVPLALHGHTLYQAMFTGDLISFGVGSAISAILWLTVAIYWVSGFFYALQGLQTLVAPLAAVAVLLPLLFPVPQPLTNTALPAFKLHLLVAMLAYSLLTIAALHALLMAEIERRLHHATLPAMLTHLPPLLSLETILFRVIWAGFILLTLTLLSGAIFSEEVFGQPLKLNHKTLLGFISWGVFAALLAGRTLYGWRGRTAIRWTLAGFVVLLLAYIGSRFVLQVILGR